LAKKAKKPVKDRKSKKDKKRKKEKKSERRRRGKGDEEDAAERARQRVAEKAVKRNAVLEAISQETLRQPPARQPPSYLTMGDFCARNAELAVYCLEAHGRHLLDLDLAAASRLFFAFAQQWNRGELPPRFYAGIGATQLEPNTRTAYKWSFVDKLDPLELASAGRPDTDTNQRSFYDLPKEFRRRREGEEETPWERDRREERERRDQDRQDEDPFEQRKRWERLAKEKEKAPEY